MFKHMWLKMEIYSLQLRQKSESDYNLLPVTLRWAASVLAAGSETWLDDCQNEGSSINTDSNCLSLVVAALEMANRFNNSV